MSSSVESAVSRFTEIDRTRASKLCVESLAVVQHGGTVKVFGSILDPDIYDPAVINAFVRAKTVQGASSIQVVAGPFVITDESGHNPVVDTLAVAQGGNKPVVDQVHFRLTQGHIEDFMVIANPDGSLHWSSEFSYSLLPSSRYIAAKVAGNLEEIYCQAEHNGQIFDATVSLIRGRPQDTTIGLPLRITRANLDQLVYIVGEERNRYLEDLDPEQLLGLPGARQLFLSPTFPSYLAP